MTQWTQGSLVGASGSSTIKASSFAAAATPDHVKGGDKSSPSPVCRRGMESPSEKAELLTVRLIVGFPDTARARRAHQMSMPAKGPLRWVLETYTRSHSHSHHPVYRNGIETTEVGRQCGDSSSWRAKADSIRF